VKEYIFKVKVVDKKIGIEVELPPQKWTDKGEALAKDWLRVSVQEDFKSTHGHYPSEVVLECMNSDIGVISEERFEEGR